METVPPEARPPIDVAAGLVFRGGKLLITQRPAGAHLAGCWEFPGGKREAGESFEECLRRELQEELGVEIQVISLLQEITHIYPEKTVRLRFFACRLLAGEPAALGCAGLAWVTATQLGDYHFPPADAALLARLRSTPEWWEA